jgi:3-dehydroquinate synthase
LFEGVQVSLETIKVALGERSYHIALGAGILDTVGSLCREIGLSGTAAVVSNTTVAPLYYHRVRASLELVGYRVLLVELPDGEGFKNSATLNLIYDALVDAALDRGSFIVALGGGVIGDMAGFAAASFLRGIPFVQVPTTLLSQVDSSVGGKTGINHPKGKNLIGAFYQPRAVLIDVVTLDTLPEREYLSGLGEIVKYGAVLDADFFDFLERNARSLLARDKAALIQAVGRSCSIKARIVEADEREGGVRAVLNYGHTLGHAVETLTGYTRYLHGEAVAIGMVQAARFSESLGFCTAADRERIEALLELFGLPRELPAFPARDYLGALSHDKKVRDSGLTFIANSGIGAYRMEKVTDLKALLEICGIGE